MKIPSLPFELKGTSFTIPAIYLQSSDLEIISAHLAAKVEEATAFFRNAPVVIDLSRVGKEDFPDLSRVVQLLQKHGFVPVGLSGGNEKHNQVANGMGLALLTSTSVKDKQKSSDDLAEAVEKEKRKSCEKEESPARVVEQIKKVQPRESVQQKVALSGVSNRTITTPVRSGQRVVVPHGDLTVTASVGSGAEIIAAGNIHVYGTLHGRAIAGSKGDESARIFCKRLDADLISIAGIYQVNEDFSEEIRSVPVQIHLRGESLIINEV
jgi:septum site-determining protein MinC